MGIQARLFLHQVQLAVGVECRKSVVLVRVAAKEGQ